MIKRKVEITAHARQRLRERFPNVPESVFQTFVSSARYSGTDIREIEKRDPKRAEWVKTRFRYNKTTRIILYKNGIFVFSGNHGHVRTLVTVVNIETADDNN